MKDLPSASESLPVKRDISARAIRVRAGGVIPSLMKFPSLLIASCPPDRKRVVRSRILHIDDDPAMLKIVAAVLSLDPAFETKGCLSGEEGVRTAAEWLPDLILSDVSMPGVGGLELIDRLRRRAATQSIPVVFTTSRSRLDHVAQFMAQGASGVIFKPFDLRDLIGSVRKYLDLAAAEQQAVIPPDVDIGGRLRDDRATLSELRGAFSAGGEPTKLREVVHKLTGVAGLYGYEAISEAAARLERELDRLARGHAMLTDAMSRLDDLLGTLDRDIPPQPERPIMPEKAE